jgi:hypothetical protein
MPNPASNPKGSRISTPCQKKRGWLTLVSKEVFPISRVKVNLSWGRFCHTFEKRRNGKFSDFSEFTELWRWVVVYS